jgi:hypothetical protein
MSRLTDFIDSNLVETDYGGNYTGIREPSLGELRRLRHLLDVAYEAALRDAPPESDEVHGDAG